MRYFLILFALISINCIAEPINELLCPKFDDERAKQFDPERVYIKDTVRRYPERKYYSYDEFYESIKNIPDIMEGKALIELDDTLIAETLSLVAFKLTYNDRSYHDKDNNQWAITTELSVPHVQYKTQFGVLSGSNRGEFGGELIFVNKSSTINRLAEINVEDIYIFSSGYIVTSGLAHMSSNHGEVYFVSFKNEEIKIQKIHGLLGAPKNSLKISSKEILINSRDGSQVLNIDGSLRTVQCKI
jgi:hypothetical protein